MSGKHLPSLLKITVMKGNSYISSLFAAYGFFNVRYSVISNASLNIYPLLGAGIGGGGTPKN